MKQRILCLLLAACMLLSLGTPGVCAAAPRRHSVTINAAPMAEQDITWEVNDGLMTISGKGAVPDYAQGEAPWLGEEVYSLIIGDGITSLGSNAFRGMAKLQDVIVGRGVTDISATAFNNCPGLSEVVFLGDDHMIPSGTFSYCTRLGMFRFAGDQPALEAGSLATGYKYIIVPIYVCDSAEGYVEFAQRLNVMAEKLAPYGIRTGYHAHACDFKEFDGVAIWDIIAQNTCPEVVLQLDTGNTACGGADVLTTFAKYPGRNQSVHFKPYHKDDELAGIGKDQLPWNECFEWCEGPGRTEWIVVEYEHDVDMTAMLNDTYSFLRSVRPL
jgi:hypothetical protein